MILTKTQTIDAITAQNGYTRKKSIGTVETIFEFIKSTLASGEDVLLIGLENFVSRINLVAKVAIK